MLAIQIYTSFFRKRKKEYIIYMRIIMTSYEVHFIWSFEPEGLVSSYIFHYLDFTAILLGREEHSHMKEKYSVSTSFKNSFC